METKISSLERMLTDVQQDVATIRSNYATREDVATIRSNYATREDVIQVKADLLKEMNLQTWRLVTWVTAAMGLYSGIIYFIARHVD